MSWPSLIVGGGPPLEAVRVRVIVLTAGRGTWSHQIILSQCSVWAMGRGEVERPGEGRGGGRGRAGPRPSSDTHTVSVLHNSKL